MVLLLLVLVFVAVQFINTVTKKAVLTVLIVNPKTIETEALRRDVEIYLDEKDPKHYVQINTAMLPEGSDFQTTPAINAMVASNSVDVIIAPEAVHEILEGEGLYLQIDGLFSDLPIDAVKRINPHRLDLNGSTMMNAYQLFTEDNAYLSVLRSSENLEEVKGFIQLITGYSPYK